MSETVRVGMVIDPVGGYGRGVIRGIVAFARERPEWMIEIEPRWAFDKPLAVEDWNVDGMIVQVHSREFEQQILDRGILATNVSNFVADLQLPTVVPDDLAIGRLAAEYLRAKGLSSFAFFGAVTTEFAILRRRSFEETLAAICPGHKYAAADSYGADLALWINSLPKPVGILGGNDDAAHHLLNICRRSNIRVPDSVAVLGVDDDELLNALVTPSLSSIRLSTERIGYEAASMLDRMIRGEALPGSTRERVLPLNVVTRGSTDLLAVADAEVAAALKFIRESAAAPIGVQDVSNSVAISRRSLERRFKASLGRGVLSEILRVHIDRAKRLLAETDLPMPKVARDSGFPNATRLGIVFRRLEAMTPSDYRGKYRTGERRV
jgi:LacI family transcriptional regulator